MASSAEEKEAQDQIKNLYTLSYNSNKRREVWSKLLREANGPILDIGSGPVPLITSDKLVVHIDNNWSVNPATSSLKNVRILKQQLSKDDFFEAAAQNLPFTTNSFPTVAIAYLFEAIPSPKTKEHVINEALRVSSDRVYIELATGSKGKDGGVESKISDPIIPRLKKSDVESVKTDYYNRYWKSIFVDVKLNKQRVKTNI